MTRSFRTIVLETGVVGGLLFTIHASIPYCGSWPLIWPALAGGTAVWLATREPQLHPWRTGLAAALLSGLITGAIAFIGTSVVVYVALHTGMARSAVRQAGVSPGFVTSMGMIALAMLGLVDVVVAFAAGALMLPVRYFQMRRAHT
jgi:hypothetical protein